VRNAADGTRRPPEAGDGHLGHSQISLTMNLYSHVIPAMQVEVAARMDEMLSPLAVKSTVSADKETPVTKHEQTLN
jgi:hypothetical protein